MQLKLLAAGTRVPAWITAGFDDFARRMPRHLPLILDEVPVAKRTATRSVTQCIAEEQAQFERRILKDHRVVALDVTGKALSTEALAKQIEQWQQDGRDACLLIGGPDGLAPDLVKRADQRWSLSALTLPHALVRVVVAEALYRAWTVLENHPYHRGSQ